MNEQVEIKFNLTEGNVSEHSTEMPPRKKTKQKGNVQH